MLPAPALHISDQDGSLRESHHGFDLVVGDVERVDQQEAQVLLRQVDMVFLYLPDRVVELCEEGPATLILLAPQVVCQLG